MNVKTPKNAFARRAVAGLCLMGASLGFADTPDVFDTAWTGLLKLAQCSNGLTNSNRAFFWTDVANSGTHDTVVEVGVVSGNGQLATIPTAGYGYAFSYKDCGLTQPPAPGPGQLTIRFIDPVASGFKSDDPSAWPAPATWVYKRIPSVHVDANWSGGILTPRPTPNPYFRIQAYRDFGQAGEVTGSSTGSAQTGVRYEFADALGIKDVYIHTDYSENDINNLILGNDVIPVFVTEPRSVRVIQSRAVTFATAVQGSSPLQYQWYRDGAPVKDGRYTVTERITQGGKIGKVRLSQHVIAGATTAALAISNVRAADAGSYYLVVTNKAGSASSKTAQLTVGVPVVSKFPPGIMHVLP